MENKKQHLFQYIDCETQQETSSVISTCTISHFSSGSKYVNLDI